jgi:beta-lactamase class A
MIGRPSPIAAVPDADTTSQFLMTNSTVYCEGNARAAKRLWERLSARFQSSAAVAVYHFQTDTYCGYRHQDTFYMASLAKVTTLAALLWQRQLKDKTLTSQERAWARLAITVSDNDAQSALWHRAGGGRGVTRFLRAAGMSQTVTPPGRPGTGNLTSSDGPWGLTRTTARDQVTLLNLLTHGKLLSGSNRAYVLGLMRSVTPSQRWGVPTDAPRSSSVAVKNGWLPYQGSWWVNTIGYVHGNDTDYTVAVLSKGSPTFSEGQTKVISLARDVHEALWLELA